MADLAFTGVALQDAEVALLLTAVVVAGLGWAAFASVDSLPEPLRARAVHGSNGDHGDLVDAVDPDSDHVLGSQSPVVTIVEYGDFECPWTAMASPTAAELLAANHDIRYVWRHLGRGHLRSDRPVRRPGRRARHHGVASRELGVGDATWRAVKATRRPVQGEVSGARKLLPHG